MTDHAHELRRYARKIARHDGDVPAVMLAAADEIDRLRAENAGLVDDMNLLRDNNTALRAKIAEMEKQEPMGTLYDDECFVWRNGLPHESNYADWKMALYALPGAQPAPSGPDGFAWPECPKRRQSHVLFDDGYEEGWAACVAAIKAAWKSEGQIMCTINDEEPAFPVSTSNPYSGHQDGPNTWQFPGMTLRDYFAAKAMQGLFAAGGGVTRGTGEWASIAYKMADAMLVTRKEK